MIGNSDRVDCQLSKAYGFWVLDILGPQDHAATLLTFSFSRRRPLFGWVLLCAPLLVFFARWCCFRDSKSLVVKVRVSNSDEFSMRVIHSFNGHEESIIERFDEMRSSKYETCQFFALRIAHSHKPKLRSLLFRGIRKEHD
eukprot:scaffold8928_cov41-Attheya_sp.AAC.2